MFFKEGTTPFRLMQKNVQQLKTVFRKKLFTNLEHSRINE